MLHFKLKYRKAVLIYLYCSASASFLSSFTITLPSNAMELGLGSLNTQDFVTNENFRLTRRSTHPRSSALIREQDNCWNRCNCRGVSMPLSVFWSLNQPPPMTPSHKSFRQPWCDFLTKAHSLSRCTRARYKKGQRHRLKEDRRRNEFLF